MKFDIVSIGSATIDNFADAESEFIKIEGRHSKEEFIAYPLGTKVLIDHLTVSVGGGGTNTAVAFSSLGLKTAFLGKVGDDENGQVVVNSLKARDIEFVGARGGQTGYSVILNSFKNDRTILTFKGANSSLMYSELGPIDTSWIYITSMIGESFSTIEQVVSNTEAKIVFNPSSYQAELGYKNLGSMLAGVDILIVNLEEACKLMGRSARSKVSVEEMLKEISVLDPSIFVITDGGNGVYVYEKETKTLTHGLPTPSIKVIETTGAGDALGSGFTAGLAKGYSLDVALSLGMYNAESVIRSKGAKIGLLTTKAADVKLAACNRVIKKSQLK